MRKFANRASRNFPSVLASSRNWGFDPATSVLFRSHLTPFPKKSESTSDMKVTSSLCTRTYVQPAADRSSIYSTALLLLQWWRRWRSSGGGTMRIVQGKLVPDLLETGPSIAGAAIAAVEGVRRTGAPQSGALLTVNWGDAGLVQGRVSSVDGAFAWVHYPGEGVYATPIDWRCGVHLDVDARVHQWSDLGSRA
jgi:hypothetical protein